jgi:glucoamylase
VKALLAALSLLALGAPASLSEWIRREEQIATERMLLNISPQDAASGTVIASPSDSNPDYRYHWTRDASLVMDQVGHLYAQADKKERPHLLRKLRDFVLLSRQQQLAPSAEGLGEPRFRVDGSPDTTPWARPQYDGPALRALTLIRLLKVLPNGAASSEEALVRAEAIKAIRVDLDFVAKYWRKPCFDLWEEVRGFHFYTQAVQYAALLEGERFFQLGNESTLATYFAREAALLEPALNSYWDAQRKIIVASREVEGRSGYKLDGLDTAVILAALHTQMESGILSITDDRLLATASALERVFAREYSIPHAIGRFSDDIYFGGNPWYLTTAAFSELYYRVATAFEVKGSIEVTENNSGFLENHSVGSKIPSASREGQRLLARLRARGDRYLSTIRKHAGSQGELSEQFDRDAGVPVSARDLTWSYAAFLSAARVR